MKCDGVQDEFGWIEDGCARGRGAEAKGRTTGDPHAIDGMNRAPRLTITGRKQDNAQKAH